MSEPEYWKHSQWSIISKNIINITLQIDKNECIEVDIQIHKLTLDQLLDVFHGKSIVIQSRIMFMYVNIRYV